MNTILRVRRNSGDKTTKIQAAKVTLQSKPRPDWMTAENRALPLISPVARYDPPTICLDKDESLAEDDLNNGPGMDETINDVLDKLDIRDRKPRRDTSVFHREILVGAVRKPYISSEFKVKISSSFNFTCFTYDCAQLYFDLSPKT